MQAKVKRYTRYARNAFSMGSGFTAALTRPLDALVDSPIRRSHTDSLLEFSHLVKNVQREFFSFFQLDITLATVTSFRLGHATLQAITPFGLFIIIVIVCHPVPSIPQPIFGVDRFEALLNQWSRIVVSMSVTVIRIKAIERKMHSPCPVSPETPFFVMKIHCFNLHRHWGYPFLKPMCSRVKRPTV